MLKCLEFSPSDLRHNAGTFVDRGFSKLLPGSLVRSLQYRKVDLLQPLDSIMSEAFIWGKHMWPRPVPGDQTEELQRGKRPRFHHDTHSLMTPHSPCFFVQTISN